MEQLDCAIIGAGPAGLAVAASLEKAGIRYAVFEREYIGYNVARFPITMRFFSSRDLVELDDFAMTIPDEKPTREQYMTYLVRFARSRKLRVRDYTEVLSVKKESDGFLLRLRAHKGERSKARESASAEEFSITAKSVVVACGALDHPVTPDIPGANLPHVTPYFSEVYPYIGHKVLVVGSGNGAVETALVLYRAGAHVSLSYRNPELNDKKIKYWMYPDISKRLEKGEIGDYGGMELAEIFPGRVRFKKPGGEMVEGEFDFVVLQTGYEPPVGFLKEMGVSIDEKTRIPAHNEKNLESNIPGLFIAGAITGGNVSGKVFIENSRFHGEMILARLKEILGRS